MDKFFKITERGSTVKREVLAGLTTFLAMSYILIVNPLTLSETGMDINAVFTATALSAALGTLVMALYANFPVAQAPAMGMNAFFTYTVVIGLGYSWQDALFGIFCSGIIFIILSATGLREKIISAIPMSLKYATSAGIGFFIAFIGLQSAGIIVDNPATLVSIGDLTSIPTLLALAALVVMLFFHTKKNNFAIILGMLVAIILGYLLYAFGVDSQVTIPEKIISTPPSLSPIFGQVFSVDFAGLLTDLTFWTIVFSFLFVDFFDTTGTLVAVASEADLLEEDGSIKGGSKALMSDAVATTTGAVLGTSSVTTYVESLSGIKSGGRTGLTALTVAALFLLSLFFAPILTSISSYVTAPALIMVGILMASNKAKIDYSDFASQAAAFMTMLFMVTSYSISTGIAFGFITYSLVRIFQGRYKEVSPIIYFLDIIFILHYAII